MLAHQIGRMTAKEQEKAWVLDLLSDAEHSEKQAKNGPFYPELGITPESLLAYAADCRKKAEQPSKTLREALGGPPQYTPAEWACLLMQSGAKE